jgi:bleomycin hydrolase
MVAPFGHVDNMQRMKKYTSKTILAGIGVWFASDITKDFNPILSSLNDKVTNTEIVFGKNYKMNKEEQIMFKNLEVNHAMCFVGVNIDSKYRTDTWQVENSWSYVDNTTPGEDGFLVATDEYFSKYVGQVAIHKKFLSRRILNILKEEPIVLEAWSNITPALFVKPNKFEELNMKEKFLNSIR